jgi:serine/threonine protein kinase
MSGIPAGAGRCSGASGQILALLALGGTAEIYLARIGGAAGFEVRRRQVPARSPRGRSGVREDVPRRGAARGAPRSLEHRPDDGAGRAENCYYMVMEFLAGLSLAMIVRRKGVPAGGGSRATVLNMIAQACAGLHYAHDGRSTARRSTSSIATSRRRTSSPPRVGEAVDFGIAKAELRETRTQSGTIKGKFAYMSPEQCVAHNVDRRTDVFALGVIAHELLTGQRLFKRPSPYETYQAVMACDVKPRVPGRSPARSALGGEYSAE